MALPPNIAKRGLSRAEAAEYCGVSETTLTKYGPRPSKIGERNIYDRRVLDHWLDSLASLPVGMAVISDPAEELSKAIHEQAAARSQKRRRNPM